MASQNPINNTINTFSTANTAIGTGTNSGTINIGNTNSGAVNIDCGVAGINVGITANAHTSTFGSTSGASATTLQAGTGTLNVTATNSALTINSGTGALSISNDAAATTVSIATGGAAKVVTLGSTNGASSLALQCGTADFSLASATGNIIVARDTGEITEPLQSAFLAILSAAANNVTGDGTTYTIICDTEIYDQNSDYNNATGIFTAPVTGIYLFALGVEFDELSAAMTAGNSNAVATSRTIRWHLQNWGAMCSSGNSCIGNAAFYIDMDAADTLYITVQLNNGAKTADLAGNATDGYTYFGCALIC